MSHCPRHRDVVIYDQRGAGSSEPKLCPGYERVADSASNLRESAERDAKLREARHACLAELDEKGIDRLAYNTEASAADLIDLRRTLGYVSWDISGGSYGARLAQEAMVRDGQAIRSVVLSVPWRAASPHRLSNRSRPSEPSSGSSRRAGCSRRVATRFQCRAGFLCRLRELTKSPVPVPIIARMVGGIPSRLMVIGSSPASANVWDKRGIRPHPPSAARTANR